MRVLCRREGLAQCGCGLYNAGALLLFGHSFPRTAFSNSLPLPRQAVGGGEEGPPYNPPQLPPDTASRLACFAGRRCRLGPSQFLSSPLVIIATAALSAKSMPLLPPQEYIKTGEMYSLDY